MAGTYDIVATLVDELAVRGLSEACISPGSRSTPLALTIARHPSIRRWIHHDERSAGFFALGIGRTTGSPAAVVTTSGTAAAELYPAVVEARFGRVPMVLLTADRPPRLRGTGANQTIDQVNLYGPNAKLFIDVPPADAVEPADAASFVSEAWEAALASPAGPVHLNIAFDEPLTPEGAIPRGGSPAPATPVRAVRGPARTDVDVLTGLLSEPHGVIVAGPLTDLSLVEPLTALAAATGWPILADPLSGLRAGAHDRTHVIGYADALAQAGWLDRAAPRAAIRFGPVPTSKAINAWLAAHPDCGYAVVDTTGWPDPGGTAKVITADPGTTAGTLAAARAFESRDAAWLAAWRTADSAVGSALEALPGFSELTVVDTVLRSIPEPATVWIASSMPIRQVDLVLGSTERRLRMLGNRGASGIDGFISSALGSAVATGAPTVAITGDLSLLYDLSGLVWAARHDPPLTIIVINNDGGGIFSLLPQAGLPEFEELFATPHGLDFEGFARWLGIAYSRIDETGALEAILSTAGRGLRLVEVPADRADSASSFRAAIDAARSALEALPSSL